MSNYDFDPEKIQATVLQDNYAQAIIACEVERRTAKAYQNIAACLIAIVLALIGFAGGVGLMNATKEPVQINIKQPN